MVPRVKNKKCTKCCKVLSRSKKNLECYKCSQYLHLKCSRLDKKRFLKRGFLNIFKDILNLFVIFPQIAPVTTVINMFIMAKKLSYEMAVKIRLIKNFQVLKHIHILGSQQRVMKLGTVGLANHNCFLSTV